VGELQLPGDVSDHPDPARGGGEMIIGLDETALVGLAPRLLQIQALGHRPSADRDQQQIRHHRIAVVEADEHRRIWVRFDLGDGASRAHGDAFRGERVLQDNGRFRFLARDEPRERFDHRYGRTEAPERLRELATNRAAAENSQRRGSASEVEHALVREVRDIAEPNDWRYDRRRAGRDDNTPGADAPSVDVELPGCDESAAACEDVDALGFQYVGGFGARTSRPDPNVPTSPVSDETDGKETKRIRQLRGKQLASLSVTRFAVLTRSAAVRFAARGHRTPFR
jgi:hypothetical protein